MTGWQQDIFEGDYVRLISSAEYRIESGMHGEDETTRILDKYGGKAYRVQGCKYNGKIILEGDDYHAYPPVFLRPWYNDNVDGNVAENDFTNLIGETL